MRPIFTVTLNPAVDEAIFADEVALGEINRCRFGSFDAGGKGINASRVMRRLGRPTIALGYVGGVTGSFIRSALDREDVKHDFDDVDEMTRLNVMIHETAHERRTRFYLPGARVDSVRLESLRARLESAAEGDVVLFGGSLPPGLPAETYADLVRWLRARGVLTVVDTSGEALAAALAAGPTLIKPNEEEAGEALGHVVRGDDAALDAARDLQRLGAHAVVVSQGAEGAVACTPEGSWKAFPPRLVARSTVGSGDSMVAGLALALHEGLGVAEGLRMGTAAGAGTAITPATHLCRIGDYQRLLPDVVVRSLQRTAP